MTQHTPLTELHRALGARLVDFAGYQMPLSYEGIIAEHRTVRSAVGLFDVSHMGEVFFDGANALTAADTYVTNDLSQLQDGECLYSPICNEAGGIVDDCLVYRISQTRVLFVVNAGTREKDLKWFHAKLQHDDCTITDRSDQTGLIALQGPRAAALLEQKFGLSAAAKLRPFTFAELRIADIPSTVSRTGYTGEDGFEIMCAAADAPALWNALLDQGAEYGIKPIGLGARDTLRLEARLLLYGQDMNDETTPLEAGLGWTVKLNKASFIGQAALRAQKAQGLGRKLVSLEMTARGIARPGYPIFPFSDVAALPGEADVITTAAIATAAIGTITSGTMSPTLGKAIALGYVDLPFSSNGSSLTVGVRGRPVAARVVKGPFYKRCA